MPQAARSAASTPQVAEVVPTPAVSEADPLAAPDPLTAGQDDAPVGAPVPDVKTPDPLNKTPDPLADAEDPLASPSGPKMPTQHSHWLILRQSGEHVTVRLNGVWYADFSGPTVRDITMALRPGPNTLSVTYRPQDAESWLAVEVKEGEHSPPIPDVVTYRAMPLQDADLRGDTTARPMTTTRMFRFMAQ